MKFYRHPGLPFYSRTLVWSLAFIFLEIQDRCNQEENLTTECQDLIFCLVENMHFVKLSLDLLAPSIKIYPYEKKHYF